MAQFHCLHIKQAHERLRNRRVVLQTQLKEKINDQLRVPTTTCSNLFVHKFSHWWRWNISNHMCTVGTGAATL